MKDYHQILPVNISGLQFTYQENEIRGLDDNFSISLLSLTVYDPKKASMLTLSFSSFYFYNKYK